MDDGGYGCGLGSVWAPYPAPVGRHADPRAVEARDLRLRIAEVLIAHGVAAEDVELVLPSPCRLRLMLARRRQRERDTALAVDGRVCSALLAVCPYHGDTLVGSNAGMRCAVATCRRRWPGPRWTRHCDRLAVTEIYDVDAGEYRRLCERHLAAERDDAVEMPVVGAADTA
jgi:hypothetical protein